MLLFFVKSNFCDILPYLCINQHHCLNEFLHPKNNAFKEVFWSIEITENYDAENFSFVTSFSGCYSISGSCNNHRSRRGVRGQQ